jgi:glycerophosphoryl diester phosphodiesterase
MHRLLGAALISLIAGTFANAATVLADNNDDQEFGLERAERGKSRDHGRRKSRIELGPRPAFLINDMEPSRLQRKLLSCADDEPRRTDFSIGHRGAPLQFPEHTRESYEAAFRMGAGILECDVTFTSDEELVCRHSQNDLATTTNILLTPLASTCIIPFTPAVFDATGNVVTPATAECRTSEITLEEFKSLRGKMTRSIRPRRRLRSSSMAPPPFAPIFTRVLRAAR